MLTTVISIQSHVTLTPTLLTLAMWIGGPLLGRAESSQTGTFDPQPYADLNTKPTNPYRKKPVWRWNVTKSAIAYRHLSLSDSTADANRDPDFNPSHLWQMIAREKRKAEMEREKIRYVKRKSEP